MLKILIYIKNLFVKKEQQICSNCKIGEYYLKIDGSELFCPHIECHTGFKCVNYKPVSHSIK